MSNSQDIPYGYCQCGCGGKTRLAPQTNKAIGWVKGEPIKRIQGHQGGVPQPKRYVVEDHGFSTPCWIWQGGQSSAGHGRTKDHAQGKMVPAHRYFYERKFGAVPNGMVLDHLCRVRICVNPDHVEPVTVAENNRRGLRAKLTREQVREIRRLAETAPAPKSRARGDWTREIMARFGISKKNVTNIVAGKSWRGI